MNLIIGYGQAHPILCFYLFVTAVGALPTPTDRNGTFYQWWFTFATALAAGLPRIIATKYPNSQLGKKLVG